MDLIKRKEKLREKRIKIVQQNIGRRYEARVVDGPEGVKASPGRW
jgi:hypothetical protein